MQGGGAPCAVADTVDDLGRQVLLGAHKGVGTRVRNRHDGDLLLRRNRSGLPGLRRLSGAQHPRLEQSNDRRRIARLSLRSEEAAA